MKLMNLIWFQKEYHRSEWNAAQSNQEVIDMKEVKIQKVC